MHPDLTELLLKHRSTLELQLAAYEIEIMKLPAGSCSIVRKGGHEYAYLTVHRDGKKTRNYVGRADGDDAFNLSNRIRVRRQLEGLARECGVDLAKLERMLRIAQK